MSLQKSRKAWGARRGMAVVVLVAAIGLVGKMTLAASTGGPADVRFFRGFAQNIAAVGPVRIYDHPMPHLPVYNHPPLAGWMLLVLDELAGRVADFSTLIRLPACLADFVCSILVFEIVRRRSSVRTAVACAIGVTLSPVLIPTSGFHGNTDSVAVMFALAAAHLLADRKSPLAAGVCAALSISVKFVPVVALPALVIAAFRGGRPVFVRFCAGFGALFLLVWGPVLVTVPLALKEKVLEYEGGPYRLWGLVKFADWLGAPEPVIGFMRGDGHFLVVLACVAAGAWLAWRRPSELPGVVGVTMGLLLLLSTASGVQYLAWPVAGLFVIGLWEGLSYSLVVGALASWVYWVHRAVKWNSVELAVGAVGWLILALGVASAIRKVLNTPPPSADSSRFPLQAIAPEHPLQTAETRT
ncbi:glycosyltransferase family 39 protein [Streptomyces sp. NBC_01465]|uniref:glycosyltransferase family 39 protein n=1 Tax=Streptomyces sp. NBC_01465 TaxID=2903878 RepID=UPI002E32EE0D|nr:glycosyltransferase family 39 protein [Streptomyces sp. NBC_01465]